MAERMKHYTAEFLNETFCPYCRGDGRFRAADGACIVCDGDGFLPLEEAREIKQMMEDGEFDLSLFR